MAGLILAPLFPALAAQTKIHRLGTPTGRFYPTILKSPGDLQKLLKLRKNEIQTILQMRGFNGNPDDLWKAMTTGTITESKIDPGAELPFMSARRKGKPVVFEDVIWAGKSSFSTYTVNFDSNGSHYVFYFPKDCGNFWFEGTALTQPTPPPQARISVSAGDVCLTQTPTVQVTMDNVPQGAQVQVSLDGQNVDSFAASNGPAQRQLKPYNAPGTHQIAVTMADQQASATLTVKPCPPTCDLAVNPTTAGGHDKITVDASHSHPAEGVNATIQSVNVDVFREGAKVNSISLNAPTLLRDDVKLGKSGPYSLKAVATDSLSQQSTNTCEANVEITKPKLALFAAGLGGKQRSTLQDDFPNGRCAGLIGAKFGILPMIGEHAEAELSAGAKINVRDTGNSSLFVDAAIHGLFDKGFIGGGVSFWDLTESDSRTVAALIQFGLGHGPVQFLAEGRIPFEKFDDVSNNYQIWGGVRFIFGR
ncbi:MAG: hypothetical protein C5B54_00155 [Acidobacteria bacterium]|nr:MAG: hypothetical protein C5B54_00155 [Acidobacteriota bacterium]